MNLDKNANSLANVQFFSVGKNTTMWQTTSSNYIGSPSPSGVFLRSCSSFSRHWMARGPSTWQKCWSHAPTVSTIWGLHMITCLLCQPRIVRHMVTALLVFWDLVCGTICQKRSGVVVVCHLSRVHLKHIFSNSRLGFNIISSKYFLVTLNCVVCGCILGELFLIFA